jgi:hypothetical protein
MNENTKKLFTFNKLSKKKEDTLLKNDNLINLKEKCFSEIELIKYNAEIERKTLAKKLGLLSDTTWKKIVEKNDEIIENTAIRFK